MRCLLKAVKNLLQMLCLNEALDEVPIESSEELAADAVFE